MDNITNKQTNKQTNFYCQSLRPYELNNHTKITDLNNNWLTNWLITYLKLIEMIIFLSIDYS